MPIRVEYNDRYDEWDVDSGPPLWLHTAEQTREEALKTARSKSNGQDILVKGPRMDSFKTV